MLNTVRMSQDSSSSPVGRRTWGQWDRDAPSGTTGRCTGSSVETCPTPPGSAGGGEGSARAGFEEEVLVEADS